MIFRFHLVDGTHVDNTGWGEGLTNDEQIDLLHDTLHKELRLMMQTRVTRFLDVPDGGRNHLNIINITHIIRIECLQDD